MRAGARIRIHPNLTPTPHPSSQLPTKMNSFLVIALLASCGAVSVHAAMTPAQQAAWNLGLKYAELQGNGDFETMCMETMAGDASFTINWDAAFVPWGGVWNSPPGATNCPSLFSGCKNAHAHPHPHIPCCTVQSLHCQRTNS